MKTLRNIVTVKELAEEVYACGRYLKENFSEADLKGPGEDVAGTDCRLQIHDGSWAFHSGSSDYDQDHRGAWGAGFVPRGVSKAEARRIAADLISEASESYEDDDEA